MQRFSIFIAVSLIASTIHGQGATKSADSKNPSTSLEQSETVAKEYFESFQKTGVPTAQAVAAAADKAREQGTIETWTDAAAIANAYANVVDVLTQHYSGLYYASRSSGSNGNYAYISKAADYEKIRNNYLQIRNDAYYQLAKLYAAKGDEAKALSFVVTAVKLSGSEPNLQSENLIRQLIGLGE